jgi:hypothetical protein
MPNSKSSHRKSDEFRHRFGGTDSEAAPVRYLQRNRDEMLGLVFHAILLAGLVVALAFLAGSLRRLCGAHGGRQPVWLEPLALAGLAALATFAVRRIIAKVRQVRELNRELHALRAQIAALRQEMRHRD